MISAFESLLPVTQTDPRQGFCPGWDSFYWTSLSFKSNKSNSTNPTNQAARLAIGITLCVCVLLLLQVSAAPC